MSRRGTHDPEKFRREVLPKMQAGRAARRAMERTARPLEVKFWEKVDKRGPDECWNWMGAHDHLGYGRMQVGPKNTLAHHISCALHGIPIPGYPKKSKNCIHHVCENKGCVNPAHLRVVAQADNCGALAPPTPHWLNKIKTSCKYGHPLSGANLGIVRGNRGMPTRVCLTCYPRCWMWAVERREPPPGAKIKAWRGPYQLQSAP